MYHEYKCSSETLCLLFVDYIKETQLKSFHLYCWTLCTCLWNFHITFSLTVPMCMYDRYTGLWIWMILYLAMSCFLLIQTSPFQHTFGFHKKLQNLVKRCSICELGPIWSISLKLCLIGHFSWLPWWHPTRFMLYSCTPLMHYLYHLSLIAQSVIPPWSLGTAQQNFIISVPILYFLVMTLIWIKNKRIILVRKGQLGGNCSSEAYLVEKIVPSHFYSPKSATVWHLCSKHCSWPIEAVSTSDWVPHLQL